MRLSKLRLAMFCAVTLIAFALAGCNAGQSSTSGDAQASVGDGGNRAATMIEGLKNEGVLTVGVRSTVVAPFVIGAGDSISGLDIDLGSSLANELNLTAAFISVEDVGKALQESCDVVIDVPASEASGFDVVGDYAELGYAFFHKGETKVSTVDEINNKSVAVQQGSPAQMALNVTSLAMKEVSFASLNESFEALENGTVDYVLCQSCSGAYLTAWLDVLNFAGLLNEPASQGIAIASGEGAVSKAIREAYARMSENGVLAEIHRSWLGNFPKLSAESVIQGIPMKEPDGQSLSNIATMQEVLLVAQDGSTAGANAVTPAEARALGASMQGVSDSSGEEAQSQEQSVRTQTSQEQAVDSSRPQQSQPSQSEPYQPDYTEYSSMYEAPEDADAGITYSSEPVNYDAPSEGANSENARQNTNSDNGGVYTESSEY